MEIIRGKIHSAKKVVVYGPEGIGKSTFASRFPDPVFIDTEGSTKDMDVARFEKATSWQMLLDQVQYVRTHPDICKTLVIDTADWAEQMCVKHICDKHQKDGVESFGYGNGYVYVKEEFGRFLNLLEEVIEKGIHVVLTAHAHIKKFDLPDEMGSYDRWEMKLGKKTSSQTSPLVKEWADMVLFANYKTMVYNVDGQGTQKGKNKAQGGARVMYTTHHPCWDAKNRYGLPDEIPMEYEAIAHIIEPSKTSGTAKQEETSAVKPPQRSQPPKEEKKKTESAPIPVVQDPVQQELPLNKPEAKDTDSVPDYMVLQYSREENVPKALLDLMIANRVTEWDIQNAVGEKGYFPSDMPIEQYPDDFVQGCLVAAWPKVYDLIVKTQKTLDKEVPFK